MKEDFAAKVCDVAGMKHILDTHPGDSLDFECLQLSWEALRALCDALLVRAYVTSINLGSTGLDDASLIMLAPALAGTPSLRHLRLHVNHLTDHGVKRLLTALSPHSFLETVDLRYNPIVGLEHDSLGAYIQSNPKLRELNLAHTRITDVGASHISQALQFNTHLTSLTLTSTPIGVRGSLALDKAAADKPNLTLYGVASYNPELFKPLLEARSFSDPPRGGRG